MFVMNADDFMKEDICSSFKLLKTGFKKSLGFFFPICVCVCVCEYTHILVQCVNE